MLLCTCNCGSAPSSLISGNDAWDDKLYNITFRSNTLMKREREREREFTTNITLPNNWSKYRHSTCILLAITAVPMYVSQLPTLHHSIIKLAYTRVAGTVLPFITDFTLQCLMPWPYFIKTNDARVCWQSSRHDGSVAIIKFVLESNLIWLLRIVLNYSFIH